MQIIEPRPKARQPFKTRKEVVGQANKIMDLISSADSAEEEQLTQDTDLLQSWTCGGILKKIKDEPKFDKSKND